MIELFTSMEWSRLCWDKSWQDKIQIQELLPKIDQKLKVTLYWNEDYIGEGIRHFLWLPPHSELNGLADSRPYEIFKARIITGVVTNLEKISSHGDISADFVVQDIRLLMDVLLTIPKSRDFSFPTINEPDGRKMDYWSYCASKYDSWSAKLGNRMYLYSLIPDGVMEALFEYKNDALYLCYHSVHPPATYETLLLDYKLTKDEQILFESIIESAQPIECDDAYALDQALSDDEIRGAIYC